MYARIAASLALVCFTTILGCERRSDNPAEKVGEAIEEVGDKVEDAAD